MSYITDLINDSAKTHGSDVSPVPTVTKTTAGSSGEGGSAGLLGGPGINLPAEPTPTIYRKYSFLAIDDGLDMFFNLDAMNLDPDVAEQARLDYNLENYPNFAEGFVSWVPETPQVNLLYDFFCRKI